MTAALLLKMLVIPKTQASETAPKTYPGPGGTVKGGLGLYYEVPKHLLKGFGYYQDFRKFTPYWWEDYAKFQIKSKLYLSDRWYFPRAQTLQQKPRYGSKTYKLGKKCPTGTVRTNRNRCVQRNRESSGRSSSGSNYQYPSWRSHKGGLDIL